MACDAWNGAWVRFTESYLEIRVSPKVLEINLDPEGGVRPGAVCVVELRHPGDVQVEHVLLHLQMYVDIMIN